MRIYLTFLSAVALMLVLASCSQKTSTAATTPSSTVTPQADKRGSGDRKRGTRGQPKFAEMLTKMDTNKDGKIELAETEGKLKENFTKMDTNQDGFISEEEFKNAPRPKRGRRGGQN